MAHALPSCVRWNNAPTCRNANSPRRSASAWARHITCCTPCSTKGLVKARNFRRSGNKLAYAYVLTPNGMREKLVLTRAFLSRKEGEFEQLKHTIAALKSELADSVQ